MSDINIIRMVDIVKAIKESKRKMQDGSYNTKPIDPEYFKKYYHKHGAELTVCPHCGIECRKNYMYQHSKTNKCDRRMRQRFATTGLPNMKSSNEI